MNVGYVRVSTEEQNEARQYEALKRYDIDRFFCDKASGKDTDRPAFREMMRAIRPGDSIYVEDFSRLARSTEDLLRIVRELESGGVSLISLKERLDTSTPAGRLMLTVIAAINEFERANILERQREGIEIAKRNGVYKGRKRIGLPESFPRYYEQWQRCTLTKKDIAGLLGVSRPTADRLFREYEEILQEADE